MGYYHGIGRQNKSNKEVADLVKELSAEERKELTNETTSEKK